MELPTPSFIEGPPLDLIKVSLGNTAMFERNVRQGPDRSTTSEKRNSGVSWGSPSTFSFFHRG
uniref:Uncharacterized protein n=1 Tax=Ursus americanus TaxID=9643 RepID=A0A452QJS3_URSAM